MSILNNAIRQRLIFCAVAALALIMTACSDSPATSPQPTVSAAAVTPAPVPTAAAVAEPTTTTPRDTATAALAARLTDEGLKYLTAFTEDFSPRESRSERERATADFLAAEMRQLGYTTSIQPISAEFIALIDVATVSLLSPQQRELSTHPIRLTGFGDVTAPMTAVGKAFWDDILPQGLSGSIALIERGDITFEEKVKRVADAGAVGAVIYNNIPGGFGGLLMNQASIPAVSITQKDGNDILRLIEQGEQVEANIIVSISKNGSQNVIAEKPGTDPQGKVVVLGAHYDSVPETQAANDNGTGVSALVLMAREIADKDFPFTIRLIFFGVEEIGLFGSRYYVQSLTESERENIIAMLNFDAMGAGNAAILGDAHLTERVLQLGEASGLSVEASVGMQRGSSDHAPFQEAGIPAVFLFGDDFSRINSPADTLEFVEPSIMGTHMALGLGLLDELAMDAE